MDVLDLPQVRHAASDREREIAFEQLILEISKQFLTLSAEAFDQGMSEAFRALGEAFAVDQICFFCFNSQEALFHPSYAWYRTEPSAAPQPLAADRFPWSREQLVRREPIHVPRIADLPREAGAEQEFCIAEGLCSLALVPVAYREALLGFILCGTVCQPRTWSERGITSLKVFGEILANVLVRRETEEDLFREKERAQVTLASIGDGVIRTDRAGRIDYLNPVAERLTGWALKDALGREVPEVYHVFSESTRRPRRNPVEICVAERRTIVLPGLFTLHSRDGQEFTIRDSVAPILDRSGQITGIVLVFRDLTQIRGLEREMAYLASHDPLTGLLNRQEFEIYLEAALESAREKKARHVMLYLDVLQFKLVNDCFGHVAGDELLRQVANQLQLEVASGDAVARLGGHQFAMLLENRNSAQARGFASDLQEMFRTIRFSWGGQFFDIELAIGIVAISATSDSVIQILKAAEAACYVARERGRQRIHVAVPNDTTMLERSGRLRWIHRIRRALAEDRFVLYYQKILPVEGEDEPAFYEILVRLVGDGGEHILPGVFIPIVESYELAPLLDRWVVRQALRLLAQSDGTPLATSPVSINLSGQSLGDEQMRDFIIEQFETTGIKPERVFFEITETATVANLNRALSFIRALKDIGCRFILDDFGSGLCSFAYLKNLPVDLLKIDGEFVRSMEQDPIRRAMIQSINQIGQVMGLATIAEWVETEATFNLLRDLGVDYVQGYWVHRPEPLVIKR